MMSRKVQKKIAPYTRTRYVWVSLPKKIFFIDKTAKISPERKKDSQHNWNRLELENSKKNYDHKAL